MSKYNYIIVVSRFSFYGVDFQKLSLFDNEGGKLKVIADDSEEWGAPSVLEMDLTEPLSLPARIEFRWITYLGKKCYEISDSLDQAKAEELWQRQQQDFPHDPFIQYIIGIAPHGGVAVWLCSKSRSVFLQWLQAEEQPMTEEELFMYTPNPEGEEVINLLMPPQKLQNVMQQHPYRLVPMEEYFEEGQWKRFDTTNIYYEDITLDGLEVSRLDGTFDHSDSNVLMHYHVAGKPKKIIVKWHEGNDSFYATFKLDETSVISLFESFFEYFPDAKADLLIRIDTRANRYEIAMTGEGLAALPLKYTQYIVFKGNKEFCRSKNYIEDLPSDEDEDDEDEDA